MSPKNLKESPSLRKAYTRCDSFRNLKPVSKKEAKKLEKEQQLSLLQLYGRLDKEIQPPIMEEED